MKAFTLVEILIVSLVLGLLTAAVIPRLAQTQFRARHAKRNADMRQIAGGVIIYQEDNGGIVPKSSMLTVDAMITGLDTYLVPRYMSSMPLDALYKPSSFLIGIYDYIQGWMPAGEQPAGFGQTPWVSRQVSAPGSYGFVPLSSPGKLDTSFALIAAFIDDPQYANRIIYPSSTSRNIFIYYRGGTYVQFLSGASQTLTTFTSIAEIKTALCNRIDRSASYSAPVHINGPNGVTCYPANNNPLAVYGYTTRDNYYRFIYIP